MGMSKKGWGEKLSKLISASKPFKNLNLKANHLIFRVTGGRPDNIKRAFVGENLYAPSILIKPL